MGASAQRNGIYAAAVARRTILRHCERSVGQQSSCPGRGAARSGATLRPAHEAARGYDLLLPATAATGAGLSFWNISNGRKMMRP